MTPVPIEATTCWLAMERSRCTSSIRGRPTLSKSTRSKRLKADQWQHVFVTYDGSSKAAGIKIYVDGEPWDWDIEQDQLTETIKTDKSLLIGSRHPGSRFKGEIDEVQMFARCLEVDEVKALAKASSIADPAWRSILKSAAQSKNSVA